MKAKKLRVAVLGAMLLVMGLFSTAHADILELDFTMWIDHNDVLTIDGAAGTAQWYYKGSYAPVGLWDGRTLETQVPTTIEVTNNGTPLNTYDWKQWTVMPAYGTPANSSILSIGELSLLAGATINSITESIIQARNSMTFGGSGTTVTIECYDWYGGASWYEAKVTFDYTPAAPVPVPAAVFLFAPGLVGLAALRRRLAK